MIAILICLELIELAAIIVLWSCLKEAYHRQRPLYPVDVEWRDTDES
ncbi:MAG: hypothetical protein J6T17_07435 [Clostridia bacterium]|nr:hypothetical protein [Clostridia bacterium]